VTVLEFTEGIVTVDLKSQVVCTGIRVLIWIFWYLGKGAAAARACGGEQRVGAAAAAAAAAAEEAHAAAAVRTELMGDRNMAESGGGRCMQHFDRNHIT
jgi:hypothetical protein